MGEGLKWLFILVVCSPLIAFFVVLSFFAIRDYQVGDLDPQSRDRQKGVGNPR